MKRVTIAFIAFMTLFCGVIQAQDLRTLFIEMPDTLQPLLTNNDRRDMIDFWDARMSTPVVNRLDGKSRITELTNDFLSVELSRSSSMQIKMLNNVAGDTLLCIVNTVAAEACDSRIHFYNTRWERVDGPYFTMPSIADFFHPSDSVGKALEVSDIYLVKLSLKADNDSLKAEYTMPLYMSRSDSARVAPQLRPLFYRWTGKRFE